MLYPNKNYRTYLSEQILKYGNNFRNLEWDITCKDGSIKTILWSNISEQYPIPGWFSWAIGIDITDRKKAKQALKESEEKLRNILENSTNLIYSHTTEHELTYLSPQVKNILGYSPEEAKIKWTEFATDNPINEEGYRKTLKAIEIGIPQPPYELELIHKRGEKIWVEVREVPVVEGGKTVFIVGALVDITERKKTQDALKESEEKYRNIFSNSLTAIYTFDLNKYFIDTNPAGVKLLGYSKEELLQMSISDVDADPVAVLPAHKNLLDGKNLTNYEHKLKRKDGKIITVLNNSIPVKNNAGKAIGMESFLFDITDRKNAEQLLLKEREKFITYIELAGVMFVAINAEGEVTLINKKGCEILEYTKDEIIGKNWFENFIYESERKKLETEFESSISGKITKPIQECFV
ncbi:MAG: PAS domain S-box protein, partial [Calditrichia bacterium]|nr:PAS domain S-box protein [Calditrichia bacterium]